jgi:uncharacterized membrane protein
MLYLWIKYIHVLSSTVLFGTGIGTASIMLYGNLTKDTRVIAAITRYVVLADWLFTATSGVIQPLSGLLMVYLMGYSFKLFWVWGSITGYLIAGCCWLPVVYLQIKMRDLAVAADKNKKPLPQKYFRYFKYWFCLGWPAFISLMIVFYLMTNKPF